MFNTLQSIQAHLSDDFAGPAQAKLVQQLVERVVRDRPSSATIAHPAVTTEEMIDAVAWNFHLLPDETYWLIQPLNVVVLRWQPLECNDCDAEAEFEVQNTAGGVSASMCRACALTSVGDRQLGPGSAQRLIGLDDLPYEARDFCRRVAAEVHDDADLI